MTVAFVVLAWLVVAVLVALLVGPLLGRVARLREKHEAPADPLRWVHPSGGTPIGRRRV